MKKLLTAVVVMALVFCAFTAYAGHGRAKPIKKGILLVAFGTSEETAKVAFSNIEKMVSGVFPGISVEWAYTSHVIRHKLLKQGEILQSPAQALSNMIDKGFTHVAVQSLHTIPGEEFHSLLQTVKSFKAMPDGFENITIGYPLLGNQDSVASVVEAILSTVPSARKPDEAVVLMGHGSHHSANIYYSALNWQVQQRDSNIIMGTVEAYPELDSVIAYLKKNNIKKVWLMPFMSVAGDHAKNDMAGPEDDSWKSVLTKDGFKCEVVLKGTAEYDAFVNIWVAQLKVAFAHL